ncbi:hypothetical protein GLOTRDRAFT_109385 [Gloeophyllum trabeum ATCC 11539]|uniref:Uncharacterized protein n=1 Tax=Gloeophyllum trabeum (strain ATCC 11539 / FP-39264 / Madison 617) TaxID=670483 RepID=S7S5L1_GLOTA|nr:uncharacterized protein GLOTRDRAFT_109385 [Gloeophyllum trabeum ATCC 11539]EPQ61284.1 hypothetical protein GLOTRDRAFT_109385 [Gloeophyllum trabeum ATCC 11539]
MSASPSTISAIAGLPADAVARCEKEARRDGAFAGLTCGLTGALVGAKLMRLNRNLTVVSGCLTGVLSGYLFTLAFRDANIAQLRKEVQLNARSTSFVAVDHTQ